jgi:CheY-like chemotaxis protein
MKKNNARHAVYPANGEPLSQLIASGNTIGINPNSDQNEIPKPQNASIPAYHPDEVHLLIVDDEQEVADTVDDILSVTGYHITKETNSEKALQLIDNNHYHIIITDLAMPGYSGVEVIKKIRKNNTLTELIVITGKATISASQEFIRNGINRMILKPFSPQEILVEVTNAVEKNILVRQNIALNEKLIRFSQRLSTLNEISAIIYQITDFDMVSEMIIDACVEYLNFSAAGVMIKNDGDMNYQLYDTKSRSFNALKSFTLSDLEIERDANIHFSNSCILKVNNGEIYLSEKSITIEGNHTHCGFFPLQYHNEFLGYIIVLMKNEMDDNDEKLTNILSAQVAPVFYSLLKKQTQSSKLGDINSIIAESKTKAKNNLTPISYILFRISFDCDIERSIIFEDISSSLETYFKEKIKEPDSIFWLTPDTGFILLHNTELFSAENACRSIKKEIENLSAEYRFKLNYSVNGYPQIGENVTSVHHLLWTSLLQELDKK